MSFPQAEGTQDTFEGNIIMFNMRPSSSMPGIRVRPVEDVPGFRMGNNKENTPELLGNRPSTAPAAALHPSVAYATFLNAVGRRAHRFPVPEETTSADGLMTPNLVPGPGGDGGGRGWDKCTLMAGTQQFGMCLYLCPDGTVRRLDRGPLGCQPFIFRSGGLGL